MFNFQSLFLVYALKFDFRQKCNKCILKRELSVFYSLLSECYTQLRSPTVSDQSAIFVLTLNNSAKKCQTAQSVHANYRERFTLSDGINLIYL